MKSLEGKWALITGATKGIGRATAETFAREGANLILVARDQDQLFQLSQKLSELVTASYIAADIGSELGREEIISFCNSNLEHLDILVNNVGTNIRKPSLEFSNDELQNLININITGAWSLCRELHPLMSQSASPSIVNVSSVASQRYVGTSTAAYSMTKAAIDQMTRFFSVEWAPLGFRVNAVNPWYIRTPLVDEVLKDRSKEKKILDFTPLGRVGEPHEVAEAICFLASDKASFINGVVLPVDGGFSNLGMR